MKTKELAATFHRKAAETDDPRRAQFQLEVAAALDRLTACEPVIELVRELQDANNRIVEAEFRHEQVFVARAIGDYNEVASKLRGVPLPAKVTT